MDIPHILPPPCSQALAAMVMDGTVLYSRRLESEPLHIRLLTVEAGEVDDGETTIVCRLDTFCFDTSMPDYTALSYTWGNAESSVEITVNGVCKHVSPNLAAFFWHWIQNHARDNKTENLSRYLWVDALCINQEDEKEKSFQVAAMGRIYSSATATIAWLGVEGQNSAVGLEYIGRIARALKDSWSEQTVDFTTDLRVWFQKNPRLAHAMTTPPRGGEPHILLNSRIWDGILRLFQRDYWQRSWIQQEIVLSQSVRLWCGPSQSPMGDVYKLADWLVDFRLLFGARGDRGLDLGPWQDVIGEWRHSMVHDFVDCVHHFSGLRRTFSTSPSSVDQKQNPMLFHLLRTAGGKFKSTDPRDKLYSLLGLLPLCLIPDYTHSVELVYTEFTKSCLQGQGGLSYLELAGPGTLDDLTEVQRLFLPSWAINWDALSSQVRPKSRRPKSNQPTKFSINARFDGNVLCIDGNSICAIEAHSKETNDMVKFFTEIIHGFARNNPGGSPVVEFFRAVCLDVEPGKEHGIGLAMAMITMDAGFDVLDRVVHALRCRLGMSIKDILNCFDHFPESADRLYRDVGFGSMFRAPDLPVDSTTVEDYLRIHQQNIPDIYYKRSDDELVSNFAKFNLFMTAKGYAGWGPAAAQYGDLVSLVPGCEFPLLLRQVDDYFILLGPCWVLGLMDGEYYKGRRDIADDLREFRIM